MGVEDLFRQSEFTLWVEGFADSLQSVEEEWVGRCSRLDIRCVGGVIGVDCCKTACVTLAQEICCRALFQWSIDVLRDNWRTVNTLIADLLLLRSPALILNVIVTVGEAWECREEKSSGCKAMSALGETVIFN